MIRVWNDKVIFEANGETPDEEHPHHTPRYYDGQGVYYLKKKCREPTDQELAKFETVREQYENVTAISVPDNG